MRALSTTIHMSSCGNTNNNNNNSARARGGACGGGLCGVAYLLRRAFKDLKLLSIIMLVWLFIVLLVMAEIGVFSNTTFVAWGPRPTLSFLHVPIDTGYKYGLLLVMIMVHTFISGTPRPSLICVCAVVLFGCTAYSISWMGAVCGCAADSERQTLSRTGWCRTC